MKLEGALLDTAVALAEGFVRTRSRYGDAPELWDTGGGFYRVTGEVGQVGDERWRPSTNWDHAGSIIQRERIGIEFWVMSGERYWGAGLKDENGHDLPDLNPAKHAEMASGWCPVMATGTTPLIAAMRAYVASKFGDEVELP